MAKAENRTSYPPVTVAPARVQESGLLKDDIRLDFPAEAGRFDTVLLGRATRKAKQATELWRAYAEREGAAEVVPLLVVQVPNKPSDELLLSAFTTIRETWPKVEPDAMAHVFGEHVPINIGGFMVPYIGPETVAGSHPHPRAVRQGRDLYGLGLPSCRSPGVVPSRQGRNPHHPASRADGSDSAWLGGCQATIS